MRYPSHQHGRTSLENEQFERAVRELWENIPTVTQNLQKLYDSCSEHAEFAGHLCNELLSVQALLEELHSLLKGGHNGA